ncbi:exo-alpha-sialidase [Bacillus sp. 1P02SD]|uniref:exo-alpha-sialidase n=1 Tax=Bacillus sp. 1P02SD TaxID=3132264 RepID=UPI0039A09A68
MVKSRRYLSKKRFKCCLAILSLFFFAFLVGNPENPVHAIEANTPLGLHVTDSWNVTDQNTFPDGVLLQAQRPALTEAPNGDLLAVFNTSGDAHPGGELRMIRSTDQGRTWGPSELIATSFLFGEKGSISSTRGMTTLTNGTILLPYNDAVNHSNYNNRESRLFIAKSTDNGFTWEGTQQEVELPIPIREAHIGGSQILELEDGTLLLPIWGATELVEDWQTNPMRWRSGVLRSFDGGETWSDYRTIAYDPNNPPQYPPFHGSKYTSGANELSLQELPDGRIVSIIRYAAGVGPDKGQVYLSYSSDQGATWTKPVATGKQAEALSLTLSACSKYLPEGESKLLMGHRYLSDSGQRVGKAAISVSYDSGVTWEAPVYLQDPSGEANLGAATGEIAFHHLNDTQLLVLFQVSLNGAPFKIVANIIEDSSNPSDCISEYNVAKEGQKTNPTFFIERSDRDEWPWPFAVRKTQSNATTFVKDVIADQAPKLSCIPSNSMQLLRNGIPLDPDKTLAEVGVQNGDVLQLLDRKPQSNHFKVGFAEMDVSPETRHIYSWDNACASGPIAFDYNSRSLGIEVNKPHTKVIDTVELRNRDDRNRLNGNNYELYSSPDNIHYTKVTDWTFTTKTEEGRIIHVFSGLNVADNYLKIHQSHTNTSYRFVISNTREDIHVKFTQAK